MLAVVRRLGGIEFNGAVDGDGTRWTCSKLVGWHDGPSMRQQSMDLAGEWGEVPTENLYGGRHMVLYGGAIPGPGVTTDEMADKLNDITDVTQGEKTLYVDESTPKQVQVRRNGDLRFGLAGDSPRAVEFEIPLLATDPRKYSQTLDSTVITVTAGATSDSETAPNAGKTRTYPERIVVAGTGTQPLTITVDGKEIELSQGLGAGRFLIYPQTRRVLYGPVGSEVSHYDYVTSARWGYIQPGGSVVAAERSSSTASMTVTVESRAAWI
jgi:hypothetical protein